MLFDYLQVVWGRGDGIWSVNLLTCIEVLKIRFILHVPLFKMFTYRIGEGVYLDMSLSSRSVTLNLKASCLFNQVAGWYCDNFAY